MMLVTGGMGYVGQFLLRELAQQKRSVRCVIRSSTTNEKLRQLEQWGMEWVEGDLLNGGVRRRALEGVRTVVHLAHIRYGAALLADMPGEVERVVLMSSLWRFSRVQSAAVDEVVESEHAVEGSDKPWVLLRPSMIYGPGNDRNISRLRTHLRRWRWIPIFGSGHVVHQPVYVEDVVRATIAAVDQPDIEHRSYALAGGEELTYRDLLHALGDSIGVSPLIVPLPARSLAYIIGVLREWGVRLPVDSEQIMRLQEDKRYDIADARRDLGFNPSNFRKGLKRLAGWESDDFK
ncbi:MAG: NAD-dependent epimerase/dehydratase family protein [Candidatus Latescibacterota bacterium]